MQKAEPMQKMSLSPIGLCVAEGMGEGGVCVPGLRDVRVSPEAMLQKGLIESAE